MKKNTLSIAEEEVKNLCARAVDVIQESELAQKIGSAKKQKKPLRIKFGADPSRPDLHLGHLVTLKKLKSFQDYGHKIIFIIGDFTARIGDPTGQNVTRPALSKEEVKNNAETYAQQIFKILIEKQTEVVYNSEWLNALSLEKFVHVSGCVTVSRILQRDDFSKRHEKEIPIGLHEFLYPLIQAYDSAAVKADVELGGTDQTFNLLMGRDVMRHFNMTPQVVMTMPLLEGTDGTNKMSKSLNNSIGLTEPPNEIFGKIMSIPDSLILKYFRLLTDIDEAGIRQYDEKMKKNELNPRDAKQKLAEAVVAILHGKKEAESAALWFDQTFKQKLLTQDIEEIKLEKRFFVEHNIKLYELLAMLKLVPSKSEAKRLLQQGAIEINNEKVQWSQLEDVRLHEGDVVRVGKKRFVRLGTL